MTELRYGSALVLLVALCGCGEEHSARDALWPLGNPNAPDNHSETAQRALGRAPEVKPIPPQAGNVWPGPVQPVPTISDIEQDMNQPLGQAYTPSLPSPYPPGQAPPDDGDTGQYTIPPGAAPQIVPGNPHARQ